MEEKSKLKEVLEWVYCIIIAIILVLLIKTFIGVPTIVKQTSMYPTLKQDQRLWLNRWGKTINNTPKRGDIITFESPTETFIPHANASLNNPIAIYKKEPIGIWNKFNYYVLEIGKTSYIKRVIGLPGDHVEIKDEKVFINGQELQEDYLQEYVTTGSLEGAFTNVIVPDKCLYVMGDNRAESTDSRRFGCIPFDKVESKAVLRFWPLNVFGFIN